MKVHTQTKIFQGQMLHVVFNRYSDLCTQIQKNNGNMNASNTHGQLLPYFLNRLFDT